MSLYENSKSLEFAAALIGRMHPYHAIDLQEIRDRGLDGSAYTYGMPAKMPKVKML